MARHAGTPAVIVIKSPDEIERIAEACRIVADTLDVLGAEVAVGVTTKDLERIAAGFIAKRGARAAFKGYRGYPASICTSVNEQVVHGIPSGRKLMAGDIVGIDIGVYYKGFYGDAARTFAIGAISAEARKLMDVTADSLAQGIEAAVAGGRVSDISSAVQKLVEAGGFSVVRAFVGHGIGKELHEDPQVPNYGQPGRGDRLQEGMTLAIEPMVNAGGHDVKVLPDQWTAVTADNRLSAHFEHTVAITSHGARVLTK